MAPSKRWMELVDDRLSETYEMGVQSFLNYAFKRTGKNKEIRCPCVKCSNTYSGTRELVETHMKVYGIVQNYTFWYHHGERSDEPQSESDSDDEEEIEEDESDNEMHEIIRDLYPEFSDDNRNFENFNSMSNDELEEEPNDEAKKFYRLLSKEMMNQMMKQKLKVKFYNNRVVGKNHRAFSRHLGRIVRDCNICPLRVHSWKEIDGEQKKHMWAAVTDKFEHEKMEDYCDETLAHMKDLWNKWRGDLHRKFIKPSKSIQEALKIIPEGIDRGDWEWLVKEHFSSKKFLAASKRNSNNRAKLSMPHRTGSKPIRQVIWKKGGKVGEPPSLATIFFETRKKDSMLVEQETISRYDKIVDVTQAEPSLSNIELVEKCFGPQCHDHVVCYGGGLKPNDMRTNGSKAELQSKLRESQRENQSLKNRMDEMENEVRMIKEMLQRQQSSTSPPPSNGQSI